MIFNCVLCTFLIKCGDICTCLERSLPSYEVAVLHCCNFMFSNPVPFQNPCFSAYIIMNLKLLDMSLYFFQWENSLIIPICTLSFLFVKFMLFIRVHFLCHFIGEGSEVFYRNGGEQPYERAQDRRSIFLVKSEGNICCTTSKVAEALLLLIAKDI